MLPHQPNDTLVVYPRFFALRLLGFVFEAFSRIFFSSVVFIALPVTVGRFLLTSFFPFVLSDIYSIVLGFYALWGVYLAMTTAYSHFVEGKMKEFVSITFNFLVLVGKWAVLASLWFGAIPLLFGLFVEVAVVTPMRLPMNQCAEYNPLVDWVLGTVFLNAVSQLVFHLGAFRGTRARERLVKVVTDGFYNVHFLEIVQKVISPVIIPLLMMVALPYAFARNLVVFLTNDVVLEEVILRFSYIFIFLGLNLFVLFRLLATWVPQFQQAIVDEYYLIGRRLHNYSDTPSNNNNNSTNVSN
jgi:E3 ubiquitin-protein ligase MARCH6